MNIEKKEKIVVMSLIVLVVLVIFYKYNSDNKKPIIIEENIEELEDIDYVEASQLICHISGGVNNPGIYEVKEGDRVFHIVELAGGFAEGADENRVNLAKRLEDEEKVHIPILGEETENILETVDIANEPQLININTCTKDELMTLNGVGDKTAEKIINYRENTKFNSNEDIMNVSGIGEKKYEAIKDYITVR